MASRPSRALEKAATSWPAVSSAARRFSRATASPSTTTIFSRVLFMGRAGSCQDRSCGAYRRAKPGKCKVAWEQRPGFSITIDACSRRTDSYLIPGPTELKQLELLNEEIVLCRKCPRLVRYREEVAREKRRAFREWE